MRYARCGIAIALTMAACLTVTSSALGGPKDPFLDADKRIAGLTAGELLSEQLRQWYEKPLADRSLPENQCMYAGTHDKVLIANFGPTPVAPVCTVKPGTPIFLRISSSSCNSVMHFPDEARQQSCALARVIAFETESSGNNVVLSLDGGPPTNVGVERFLTTGPQMVARLVEGSGFPFPPQTITFSSAGYVAMLRPLPPGRHTIDLRVIGGRQAGVHVQSIIDVVPGTRRW